MMRKCLARIRQNFRHALVQFFNRCNALYATRMISLIRQQPYLRHCVIKDDRLTKITEDETPKGGNICVGLFNTSLCKSICSPSRKTTQLQKKNHFAFYFTRLSTEKRVIRVQLSYRPLDPLYVHQRRGKLCWMIKLPNLPNFLVLIFKDITLLCTLLQLHAKLSAIILCYCKNRS